MTKEEKRKAKALKAAAKKKKKEEKRLAKLKHKEELNKTDNSTKENKTVMKNYHVSKRQSDGKWQVRFAKGNKAIKLFDTQAEALEYAKSLKKTQASNITIHKVDGKIRKQKYSK